MHVLPAVRLGCTDCHGGDATTTDKLSLVRAAEVPARVELAFDRESGAELRAGESRKAEDMRFVNPGDLRVAVNRPADRPPVMCRLCRRWKSC